MKVKKLLCLLAILMPMLSANCYAQIENMHSLLKNSTCKDFKILRASQFQFQNLKGLNINIEPITPSQHYSTIVDLSESTCFIMPTVNYIKAMGFSDIGIGENEYTLTIYLNDIFASLDPISFNYIKQVYVAFKIELINKSGKAIFEQVVNTGISKTLNIAGCFGVLNEAYTQTLEKINWYKIASFLKKSSEPKQVAKEEPIREIAKEEPRKEVEGYGNTALENTIIRWDVQSRPQGADVFWRVVSKTPSVKSTNNKYLQTTPYEATKSLDIRGLSYENSGDVRIILRCEKDGYYPQEKEFNVRMIIDQEEISAFFRLVKEE